MHGRNTRALLLRTDGGPEIGGGHVMRCLALAQAWREEGGRALFAAAVLAPALRRRLAEEGFDCVEIAGPRGGDDDLRMTIDGARAARVAIVLVDGYAFEPSYRQGLRDAGFAVASLDDNDEIGPCVEEIVINQNRHASEELYPQRAAHTRLLLGTEYALLRREFREWQGPPRRIPPVARHVLVTLGAADPDNVTGAVIAGLVPSLPVGTETVIVVGGSNPHGDAIAGQAAAYSDVRVLRNQREGLLSLMAWADLAVSAGGSTMWEMCFMGVPFIGIVIADNQRKPAVAMRAEGFPMLAAAEVREALPEVVARLVPDRGRRTVLSRLGHRLVDGQGAARVCRAFEELLGPG